MGPSLLTPPNHSTVAGGATPGRAAGGNEPAGRETKGAAQGHCWPISHRAVNGYERRSTSHRPSAGRRRPDRTACESGSEVARPCDDGPGAVPFPNSEDFRIDWLSARTSDRRKVRLNRVRLVTCVSSPTRTRTWNKPVNSRLPDDPNSNSTPIYGVPSGSVAPQLPDLAQTDPGLARVIVAWPQLPAPIRAAVLALVATARAVE
jgi:hypothetical protein